MCYFLYSNVTSSELFHSIVLSCEIFDYALLQLTSNKLQRQIGHLVTLVGDDQFGGLGIPLKAVSIKYCSLGLVRQHW